MTAAIESGQSHGTVETYLERRARYSREFRVRNPEEAYRRTKLWREENPERQWLLMKVSNARKQARRRGVENTLTIEDLLAVIEEFGHRCAYCFAPWDHLDHVVPMTRGGPNTRGNVVPACATCNLRKGSNGGRQGWVPSIASRFWPKLAEEIYA